MPWIGQTCFARLLEKPQSLWFNPVTAAQFTPLLPNDLRSVYATAHFCAMSIFLGDKPLGVILADCADAALSEHHYQHFKQICLLTSRALKTAPHADMDCIQSAHNPLFKEARKLVENRRERLKTGMALLDGVPS